MYGHREQFKIKNITWDFTNNGGESDFGDDLLGLSYVGIEANMLKRFIKECRWKEDLKVPPHYYEEHLEDVTPGSDHECYNADTQIVLMNWLHDKRRNYKLEYRGADPYWMFHDHCHSQSDVHGYEVSGIYSYIEYTRLLEGAELFKEHGHTMNPKTVFDVVEAWKPRFGRDAHSISTRDFQPFLSSESSEILDYFEGMGESCNPRDIDLNEIRYDPDEDEY